VVGVLKEKFQIEGIMGCRFKPYSYILRAERELRTETTVQSPAYHF